MNIVAHIYYRLNNELTITIRMPLDDVRSHSQNNISKLIIYVCIRFKFSAPPDILNHPTSSDMVVREGSNVTLQCAVTGSPIPSITWKKEDGSEIILDEEPRRGIDLIKKKHYYLNLFELSQHFYIFLAPSCPRRDE